MYLPTYGLRVPLGGRQTPPLPWQTPPRPSVETVTLYLPECWPFYIYIAVINLQFTGKPADGKGTVIHSLKDTSNF